MCRGRRAFSASRTRRIGLGRPSSHRSARFEVIEFEGYKFSRLGRFVSLLVPMNTLARMPGGS